MKKYYGVIIALIPFITGSYKSLRDWSTAEMVGYNTFSVILFALGIFLTIKAFKKQS
jgi:hypothetical protein